MLTLPSNLYVQNRLSDAGNGVFRLTPRQREVMLAERPEAAIISLPELGPMAALEAVPQCVRHWQELLNSRPQPADFPHALQTLAKQLIHLARQQPDGVVAAVLLCRWEHYTAHHAINCALLVARVAQNAEWNETESMRLVQAALCMNFGAVDLHDEMVNQPTPPTTMQRQQIDVHPLISSALLREFGIEDTELHKLILLHHERLDGRGYPFALNGEAIPPHAHLLRIVDLSCAKLMPRSYRPPLPLRQALLQIYQSTGEQLDPEMCQRLVRVLGIYPSGSFVELKNGKKALVVKQTDVHTAPLVILPGETELLDTRNDELAIARSLSGRVEARHLPLFTRYWTVS